MSRIVVGMVLKPKTVETECQNCILSSLSLQMVQQSYNKDEISGCAQLALIMVTNGGGGSKPRAFGCMSEETGRNDARK
jgi:hypothetical protein